MKTENEETMILEKYYIKTRGIRMDEAEANLYGIKRVYNSTSDLDFMNVDDISAWISGLHDPGKGEAVIVESAFKYVEGVPLYISTCIVFQTVEMCNVFYMKNQKSYKRTDGFSHLLN